MRPTCPATSAARVCHNEILAGTIYVGLQSERQNNAKGVGIRRIPEMMRSEEV